MQEVFVTLGVCLCLLVNDFMATILYQSSPNFSTMFVYVKNRNQWFFRYLGYKSREIQAKVENSELFSG